MTESYTYTFTAEAMISPPRGPSWLRLLVWLRLRKPAPLIQPPGTVPLVLDYSEGGTQRRIYIPAARIVPEEQK